MVTHGCVICYCDANDFRFGEYPHQNLSSIFVLKNFLDADSINDEIFFFFKFLQKSSQFLKISNYFFDFGHKQARNLL